MGSRAINNKKQTGRFYPQENLHSNRTKQNKRIPGVPPRSTPGGHAACKHPEDSQAGIQNTRSCNEQRNKIASNTPITKILDFLRPLTLKRNHIITLARLGLLITKS